MEEKYKVHAFYILLILCGLIIGLVAVKWHQIPDLPGLISFALTITSLVLAILAIVYAYVSNFSFQQTTVGLSRAADDVLKSAQQVRAATQQLGEQVQTIPPLLSSVGERVERTHALMLEYSSKQDTSTPKLQESASTRTEELVDRFLVGSSITGLFTLLAMKHSLETRRAVPLTVLADTVSPVGGDYPYGFLVASDSAGFLTYTLESGERMILCDEINDRLSGQIEGVLMKRIQDMPHRAELYERINKVRALFHDGATPTTPRRVRTREHETVNAPRSVSIQSQQWLGPR